MINYAPLYQPPDTDSTQSASTRLNSTLLENASFVWLLTKKTTRCLRDLNYSYMNIQTVNGAYGIYREREMEIGREIEREICL